MDRVRAATLAQIQITPPPFFLNETRDRWREIDRLAEVGTNIL